MIELRIQGQAVDLDPRTTITIEQHNPAYLGEDIDVFPGEFSYPFTLPLNDHNRRILGYPDRLDNGRPLARKLPATLLLLNNIHIQGLLYVDNPGRTSVKVYIVSNALLDIKDRELSGISEKVYDIGEGNAEVLSHMLTVSQDPLSYDYSFFPVYNRTLVDDETAPSEYDVTRFHNAFNLSTSLFTADGPVAPFPRLEVVIDEAMAATGYTFRNNWQTNDELRRLCLINNRDLRDDNGDLPSEVSLASLLSDTKAGEFMRHISRLFCLAPFTDFRRRTVTLEHLGDLLRRDTQKDWTPFAGQEYGYTQGKSALLRLAYPGGAYSESPGEFWKANQKQSAYTVEDADDISPSTDPEGFYYEYSRGDIRHFFTGQSGSGDRPIFLFKARHFGAIDNANGEEENLPEVFPVFGGPASIVGGGNWQVPMWYTSAANEGDTVEMRLAFHYGNASSSNSLAYPFGSWNNYDVARQVIPGSNYSLGWEGPFGLYEKWWKDWDTMLQNGKMVTRNFLLSPTELNSFTFDQKVRVHSKDYFVRSMKYQVSLRGISEVETKMMSVS